MKKNLILCPTCEYNGKKQVLGEIDQNGNLIVLRFHKGSTVVTGGEFEVSCGECGEKIYKKGGVNENSDIRFQWAYRATSVVVPNGSGAFLGTN